MPPKKLPNRRADDSHAEVAEPAEREFESERAIELMAEVYPQLLEACVDEDDEVDTQVVFEALAGMTGLFLADYRSYYGHEKTMDALKEFVDLALTAYQQRTEDEDGE